MCMKYLESILKDFEGHVVTLSLGLTVKSRKNITRYEIIFRHIHVRVRECGTQVWQKSSLWLSMSFDVTSVPNNIDRYKRHKPV